MEITDGKVHESKKANSFAFPKGSVVVADRGYLDFQRINVYTARDVILLRAAKAT